MDLTSSGSVIKQVRLLRLACQFFTRLPVGHIENFDPQELNQANRYFSLVGIFVGVILAGIYSIAIYLFPTNIAIILTLIANAMLTGAFHEDGLADMADGIGGGYTVEKRLEIMKDSRLGTYGAITLFLVLALKFVSMEALVMSNVFVFSLIFAHAWSRAMAASLINNTPYVTDDNVSKSKPLASQQSDHELTILIAFGLLPLLFLPPVISSFMFMFTVIMFSLLFRTIFKRWLLKRIGGFTGDCLGAAQQIMEVSIYLIIIAFVAHGGIA